MKRIQLNKDVTPLSEFRANVSATIEKARKTKRPILITQNGKGSAVLLGINEYEALIDKMELMEEIRLAEEDVKAGRVFSTDNVMSDIRKKLRTK